MRKKLLRSLTALTLIAAAFSITALSLSLLRQQRGNPQSPDAEKSKQKTLREIANERDVELIRHSESETEYHDLRVLAKAAEAIVIGQVIEGRTSFAGENSIVTTYQVDVKRVLKQTELNAPLKLGQEPPAALLTPLKFVRSGGTVNVNGHRATVKLQGHESIKAGAEYIFFFWWSPSYKAYYLAGGISGVVAVGSDSRVKPLATNPDVKLKYDNMDLENFISEVLMSR